MTNAPLTTTLKEIRSHSPCRDSWETLLKHLGKSGAEAKDCEDPLPILTVLESNGMDDALWVVDHCVNPHICRLFAADCAERVLPIFLKVRPNDDRPAKVIAVARDPKATPEERAAARAAARGRRRGRPKRAPKAIPDTRRGRERHALARNGGSSMTKPQYLTGRRPLTPEEQARFVEYREAANENREPSWLGKYAHLVGLALALGVIFLGFYVTAGGL